PPRQAARRVARPGMVPVGGDDMKFGRNRRTTFVSSIPLGRKRDFPPPTLVQSSRPPRAGPGVVAMSLQARTQGLSLTIEDDLRGALALGLLEAESVALGPLPPAFEQERDQATARLTARYGGKPTTDVPGVAEARALFHALDLDPTKTRPSSEALLRRVLQGKGLPQVNPAVDVCNLCS